MTNPKTINKILIANRGEIACRIMTTAKRLGIATVAVHSDVDHKARHVLMADEAIALGGMVAKDSYLRGDAIIDAALRCGADAIHPGYGFLSENADFAAAVAQAGLIFIGPPASAIRAMGLKDAAKALMEQSHVAVVPGYHGDEQGVDFLAAQADRIGYPIMIKARAGGGGKGMRKVDNPADFAEALASAVREAKASFGDDHVLIEKFIVSPRHIEMQIFADDHGNVVHLWERDCSLQRRHQKVIEEAPAPGMTDDVRAAMGKAACDAARAIGYRGAGTIEFIADGSQNLRPDGFWFMEMNTRLQVEHPVTEAILGLDLVAWQIMVAQGKPLPLDQSQIAARATGHAVEARLYAEDASKNFLPAIGRLRHLTIPTDHQFTWGEEASESRWDSGVGEGDDISPYYDPMIAKVIVKAENRTTAFAKLAKLLRQSQIEGLTTNQFFLANLLCHPAVQAGKLDTDLIAREMPSLIATPAPPPSSLALAGLAGLGLLQPPAADNQTMVTDVWQKLFGWREYGHSQATITLYDGARAIPSCFRWLGHQRASWRMAEDAAEQNLSWRHIQNNTWFVTLAQQSQNFSVFIDHDSASVVINDGGQGHWRLTWHDVLQGLGGDEASQEWQIRAPMPGLVKLVKAKEGQHLSKGDVILVLEAMKMEHSLTASHDCRLGKLMVKMGGQVTEGALLAELTALE